MSRPSKLPTWATGVTVVEPTDAKKAVGYTRGEYPPSDTDNWFRRLVCDWLGYFDAYDPRFGDGSDGAATFDGSATPAGCVKDSATLYHLARDCFFSSITIGAGITVQTKGFRLYCQGLCDMSAGTNRIACDGIDGANGGGGGPAAPGTILATSGGGGFATTGAGGNGGSATAALGGAGGNGGLSGVNAGGTGGTVTGITAAAGMLRVPPSMVTGFLFGASGVTIVQGGGGGGGGGGNLASSSFGGEGGGAGGVMLFACYALKLAATSKLGAKGGKGGNSTGSAAGGGGGGGGGAVILVYRDASSGTAPGSCTDVAAGAGGTGSTNNGVAGSAGSTFLIQV